MNSLSIETIEEEEARPEFEDKLNEIKISLCHSPSHFFVARWQPENCNLCSRKHNETKIR